MAKKIKNSFFYHPKHGLRTPREEIAFTARPKIHSHSQLFWYGGSIFCLPHRPNFSGIFDLGLHWVFVVRGFASPKIFCDYAPDKVHSSFELSLLLDLSLFFFPFFDDRLGSGFKELCCSVSSP